MSIQSPVLDKLRTERDQTRTAARAIAEGDNFDPDDENFKELEARAAQLDSRIKTLGDLLEKQAAADAFDGRMAKATKAAEEQQRASREGIETRESWGSVFTRSDVYREYKVHRRGQSSQVEFDSAGLETRALPTTLTDLIEAGWKPTPTKVDTTPPPEPTPLLNNISTINVSTNAIEFVRWEKIAGGADVVPEGEVKPSIEYGPVVEDDTLETIAGYTELSRQLIEDETAVRSYIDGDLRRQVLLKEEAEAVSALTAADLPSIDATDDLLADLRVGMATVQAAGYQPNVAILNPADYARLDISVMGVTNNGPRVGSGYWGLTVIPAMAQPEGTATLGDLRTAMTHFVRSQVQLYVTDSHASNFTKNVFTLLAERRAKTVVVRPDALVEIGATSGS